MMKLKKSAKEWLDMFMESHNLESREKAVYKLINCYKAWNNIIDKSSIPSLHNDFKKPCPKCNDEGVLPILDGNNKKVGEEYCPDCSGRA